MAKKRKGDPKAIESLADAELKDWFVRDILARAALERADYDRLGAIGLLAQAIAEVSAREETAAPGPG